MADSDAGPKVGRVVRILRGRDSGKYAIIIKQVDEKFVLIADGDKKKFDRPKRKNLLHLEITDFIAGDVVESIRTDGRVTNGKLRYNLGKFLEAQAEVQRKGE